MIYKLDLEKLKSFTSKDTIIDYVLQTEISFDNLVKNRNVIKILKRFNVIREIKYKLKIIKIREIIQQYKYLADFYKNNKDICQWLSYHGLYSELDCLQKNKRIPTGSTVVKPGDRFGKLTAIEEIPYERRRNKNDTEWLCKCDCGEFEIIKQISLTKKSRTHRTTCSICNNRKIKRGVNDIFTLYPQLLLQFDFLKCLQDDINPYSLYTNSKIRPWFKCQYCGDSYQKSILNQLKNPMCPKCNLNYHSSLQEQILFYYCKKWFNDAILHDTSKLGKQKPNELDIFIPSLNIGIEYDGYYYHDILSDNPHNEILKYQKCQINGVKLIRIKETREIIKKQLAIKSADSIIYVKDSVGITNKTIQDIMYILSPRATCQINVEDDMNFIISNYRNIKICNSLQSKYPKIANEWDYEKNKPLTPSQVNYGTHKKYFWICEKCGHSFHQSVNARTNQGSGCSKCASFRRVRSKAKECVCFDINGKIIKEFKTYRETSIFLSDITKTKVYDGKIKRLVISHKIYHGITIYLKKQLFPTVQKIG